MAILQDSDFASGEYKVPQSALDDDLATFITTYEKYYLLRMLGADLYAAFIADLTVGTPQVPQTVRFIDIFNPFQVDDSGILRISEGIKQMLIEFVYFHIIRENQYKNTTSGTKIPLSNVSENANSEGNLIQAYNKALDTYCAIQYKTTDEDATYPEENGIIITYTSGI